MPPKSPLPQRHGLDAAWVRTSDRNPLIPSPWLTMREWLDFKLGEHIDVVNYLEGERFVYQSGKAVLGGDRYRDNTFIWFHRDLRDEAHVPGEVTVIYRDERIVVVDKPPFLSSIPRGKHVVQSVVVRMRNELNLPELTPAHRLDRLTSGLLVLTTEKKWRSAYQMLFQQQQTEKIYLALAPTLKNTSFPVRVENHLLKVPGERSVRLLAEASPNSLSIIDEHEQLPTGNSVYRLQPVTGKTHQLRQHMMSIGAPIVGDPIYPDILPVDIDDFGTPLQLLAYSLEFKDPLTGEDRQFRSERGFPITAE